MLKLYYSIFLSLGGYVQWGTLMFVYLSVVKLSGNELRDNDSPTPPLSVHNHTMNNVDYNKEGVKDKNSLHDENLLRADGAR